MIITDKGDFPGFQHLRAAFIAAYRGNPPIAGYWNTDVWRDDTLHISELGRCPRMQMLRLQGAPKKVRSWDALSNEALMFWQGNMIHALTVGAMDWAGILKGYEQNLPDLPEGWTGHYDAIWEDRDTQIDIAWDGKTVRSNNFNYWYSWPKLKDRLQMQGYLRFLPTVHYGQVEYIDRGGSNPPQVKDIVSDRKTVDETMQRLNNWRSIMDDELPPKLEPEFSLTYRKVTNEPLHLISGIYYGPQWECEWCDYLHGVQDKKTKHWTIFPETACNPEMPDKVQVAKVLKHGTEWLLPEHQEAALEWVKDQLQSYTDEASPSEGE